MIELAQTWNRIETFTPSDSAALLNERAASSRRPPSLNKGKRNPGRCNACCARKRHVRNESRARHQPWGHQSLRGLSQELETQEAPARSAPGQRHSGQKLSRSWGRPLRRRPFRDSGYSRQGTGRRRRLLGSS